MYIYDFKFFFMSSGFSPVNLVCRRLARESTVGSFSKLNF